MELINIQIGDFEKRRLHNVNNVCRFSRGRTIEYLSYHESVLFSDFLHTMGSSTELIRSTNCEQGLENTECSMTR